MTRIGLLLFLAAIGVSAAPISSLYFFGDSLSDTGNVYAATTRLNSITFGLVPVTPASPPYYNGHFSNGPVWTETVASRLGHDSDAQPAGMSLGTFGSISGAGHNYAIGGARTGTGGALGSFDSLVPTGILAQTNYYLSGHTGDPNAMYFMLGGGNDLRDIAALTDPAAQFNAASTSAWYLAVSMYNLYQGGARNFFLMNAPNIGFIPESISAGRTGSGALASLYFNFFLDYYANLLDQLPGFELTQFDVYGFYNSVLADTATGGSLYGFTSLTPCINNQSACNTSMFFDDIHPTARVQALLGNRVADQLQASLLTSNALFTAADVVDTPEPATAGTVLVILGVGLIRLGRLGKLRGAASPPTAHKACAHRVAAKSVR